MGCGGVFAPFRAFWELVLWVFGAFMHHFQETKRSGGAQALRMNGFTANKENKEATGRNGEQNSLERGLLVTAIP